MNHKCQQLKDSKEGMYGVAISNIEYDSVRRCWVMHNQEYLSYPIISCPFCGLYLAEEVLDSTK